MLEIIVLALIGLSGGDEPRPPGKAELAAITARGRDLAGYDAAAWHASDAVMETRPKPGAFQQYIAQKTAKGWTVAFGRLNEKRDRFLIAYEATQGAKPDRFTVKPFDPPRADAGFVLAAALGIETALADFTNHFEGEQRPYNVYVLPAPKDRLWTYLLPAQTKAKVWPLGGDVRYLVSPDGKKILEKRQMHKSIIELEQREGDPSQLVAGTHSHVLSETPEDSDVFHVLARKPAVAELVCTEHCVFVVEPDGAIKFVGKPDDVFQKK